MISRDEILGSLSMSLVEFDSAQLSIQLAGMSLYASTRSDGQIDDKGKI